MKKYLLASMLILTALLTGADLIIADKGKSAYSIVIPDSPAPWDNDSAKLLAEGIFRTAKVRLPTVKESLYKNTPAIAI